MSKKYFQQRVATLGGYAISNSANSAVTASVAWNVPIDSNTSIIRIFSDNASYFKYDSDASNSLYDYFIPENAAIDIANLVNANTITIIADSSNCSIKISQY